MLEPNDRLLDEMPDGVATERERELARQWREHIQKVVDTAPPLSPEQHAKLGLIFGPSMRVTPRELEQIEAVIVAEREPSEALIRTVKRLAEGLDDV